MFIYSYVYSCFKSKRYKILLSNLPKSVRLRQFQVKGLLPCDLKFLNAINKLALLSMRFEQNANLSYILWINAYLNIVVCHWKAQVLNKLGNFYQASAVGITAKEQAVQNFVLANRFVFVLFLSKIKRLIKNIEYYKKSQITPWRHCHEYKTQILNESLDWQI